MNATPKTLATRIFDAILLTLAGALLTVLIFAGYAFLQTPAAIRQPQFEHAHFRMQVIVNGQAEDFSAAPYQKTYEKGQCSSELSREPIHFHDNRDQFVHIHWKGVTGGMVLKYYGWNHIGGLGSALGYRFDGLANVQPVPVHGQLLPALPPGTNYYVFSGNEEHFEERQFEDFVQQELEAFFGTKSNVQPETEAAASWLDALSAKATAHTGESHAGHDELARINNLLGNVVIFAQSQRPNDETIKQRFHNLVPLTESTCGG